MGSIVTDFIKFKRSTFYRDVALITFAVLFFVVCVVTGYCGFIKGRMSKMNKQIQKANHYENKLSEAIKNLENSSNNQQASSNGQSMAQGPAQTEIKTPTRPSEKGNRLDAYRVK